MAVDYDESLIQENIDEYVNDDNKIVTIRWLSLNLSIHINEAKKALTKFLKDNKGKKNGASIHATYFVSGLSKAKDGETMYKCVIVPDEHLDEVKKSFTQVTSCHVYSVQKAKLKDYTPLYQTDYDIIKESVEKSQSYSSIKCPWVQLKPKVEYMKSFDTDTANNQISKSDSVLAKQSTAATTAKAGNKKPEPKGSIANMFATAGKKNVTEDRTAAIKVKEELTSDTTAKTSKPETKKGGVLAMFNKQVNSTESKNSVTKEPAATKETKNTTKGTTAQKKRQLDSDKEEPQKKQRRRIKADVFDSSDDEQQAVSECEEEKEEVDVIKDKPESDDEVVNTSMESLKESEVVNVGSEVVEGRADKDECVGSEKKSEAANGGKKRKRTKKTVTKTFVDEDGFIVTTKETEWESATDNSDSENSQKEKTTTVAEAKKSKAEPKAKELKKKNISPQKGKQQTSLMSFFKKS